MRSSSTFSILFWIYAKRIKNNLAPLYERITVDGEKSNISLKKRIDPSLWNPHRQRIKGNNSKARNTDQYLDEVHSKLLQCFQELRAENKHITARQSRIDFKAETRLRILLYETLLSTTIQKCFKNFKAILRDYI